MKKQIRVLIIDDSLFYRDFLQRGINKSEEIEVVGTAGNATDAYEKILALKPDVLTLDVEMPGISGIDFLKKLIPERPIPTIMISGVNMSVFDALDAGAVDFVRKPQGKGREELDKYFQELMSKIKIASISKAKIGRRSGPAMLNKNINHQNFSNHKVIALGASTGGTEATATILKGLPSNIPGMLVVQHMPPGFTKMYAERLDRLCQVKVKEAEHGDLVQQGQVLIAPGDRHMKLVKKRGQLMVECFHGDKVSGHCPSVDVLFNSVAEVMGKEAVGIILTGMGRDGAQGLMSMKQKGAFTIGQDKESCVVYGMPMVAYNIGAVVKQLPCSQIAHEILNQVRK